MKTPLSNIAVAITFLLFVNFIAAVDAQEIKTGIVNCDMTKAVKVCDGKIMPANTSTISMHSGTITFISPDSVARNPDLIAKYGKEASSNGIVFYKTRKSQKHGFETNQTNDKGEKIYHVIEQMPQFPGGESALLNFVIRTLRYPIESQERGEQGKVIVSFIVNKEGKVEKPVILRSVTPLLDEEALRVVAKIPKFIPGRQNGEVVNVFYTLPVTFRLEANSNNAGNNNLPNSNNKTRSKTNFHTSF